MRKLISMVMVMFITLGVVPASAAPKVNSAIKTKIEKNIADGVLYNSFVKPIAEHYKVAPKDLHKFIASLTEEIKNLHYGEYNYIFKYVGEGKIQVFSNKTASIDSGWLSDVYELKTHEGFISNKSFVESLPVTETIDELLNYGVCKLRNINGETVSYNGLFTPPNSLNGDVTINVNIDPIISMTLDSNPEYSIENIRDTAYIPCSITSNMTSVMVKIKRDKFTTASGFDVRAEVRTDIVSVLESGNNGGNSWDSEKNEADVCVIPQQNLQGFKLTHFILPQDYINLPPGNLKFEYSLVASAGPY